MGAITVLKQMTMIAVLAAIGFFLQKKKVLDKNSTPVISRIVVDICNPALIVSTILTGNITVTAQYVERGDCNQDGKVDMEDVLMLMRYLTNLESIDADTSVMDVNRSGEVDMLDALLLLRHTMGMLSPMIAI